MRPNPLFQNKPKQWSEGDEWRLYHRFMKEYGWIPPKEFAMMPLQVVWNLLECMGEDFEREKRASQQARNKRGR